MTSTPSRRQAGTLGSCPTCRRAYTSQAEWYSLMALAATVDTVMSEHDAMQDKYLRVGMGRIRREWQAWRRAAGG